jgi:hypothetical protein
MQMISKPCPPFFHHWDFIEVMIASGATVKKSDIAAALRNAGPEIDNFLDLLQTPAVRDLLLPIYLLPSDLYGSCHYPCCVPVCNATSPMCSNHLLGIAADRSARRRLPCGSFRLKSNSRRKPERMLPKWMRF